jgi:hypothetical protein
MENLFSGISILAIVCGLVIMSYNKKEDSPAPINSSKTTAGFTWTENGGTTVTTDSAYWTTRTWGTGIRAYKCCIGKLF